MENLFQATLAGVLETARATSIVDESGKELPDIALDLPAETHERLSRIGLIPVRQSQLFAVQNSYFSHRDYLPQTLKDLTRLGLIQYGFLKKMGASAEIQGSREISFDPAGINILVSGQIPSAVSQSLKNKAGQGIKGAGINLLVQGGDALAGLLPAADHGTPELALAMNLDALVLAPNACLPGLETLAKKFDIPVILIDEAKSPDEISSRVIELAVRRRNGSYVTGSRISTLSRTDTVWSRGNEIRSGLEAGQIRGVVVVLGETNVKQAFFDRTLALIENGIQQDCLVLLGGEAGAQAGLLLEELGKRVPGKVEARMAELEKHGLTPLSYVGSLYQLPRLVALLRDIGRGKGFSSLPAVISFPEFFRASTWATAVSFLALGCAVQIGTRLPFWGSPALTEILLKEWPGVSGGVLLASPSVPDGRTQALEISSFLDVRKVRPHPPSPQR